MVLLTLVLSLSVIGYKLEGNVVSNGFFTRQGADFTSSFCSSSKASRGIQRFLWAIGHDLIIRPHLGFGTCRSLLKHSAGSIKVSIIAILLLAGDISTNPRP